jgi:hypothetical protein
LLLNQVVSDRARHTEKRKWRGRKKGV